MNTKDVMPAEWESVRGVLLAWPHAATDWAYMLDEVRGCYGRIIDALSAVTDVYIVGPESPDSAVIASAARPGRIHYIDIPTNDTWIRDYGPLAVRRNGKVMPVDYRFDGWGLKFAAALDNGVTSTLAERGFFTEKPLNRLSFTLEGGSIESDGDGTILTTSRCLLSPNRNGAHSRAEIEAELHRTLGAERVLWLENGGLDGDDTDGHIDTIARLVPPGDTIVYAGAHDRNDSDYKSLAAMASELRTLRRADGNPYNLIELPQPAPIYDDNDGSRLPATYANFLIVNRTILMPVYDQPLSDMTARMALQAAMPDYDIVCIDCRALIRQHGSLHCATMQLHPDVLAH